MRLLPTCKDDAVRERSWQVTRVKGYQRAGNWRFVLIGRHPESNRRPIEYLTVCVEDCGPNVPETLLTVRKGDVVRLFYKVTYDEGFEVPIYIRADVERVRQSRREQRSRLLRPCGPPSIRAKRPSRF